MLARDMVDPSPRLFIKDSGSSSEFGPFASGTNVKIIQSPGLEPNARPGPGAIDLTLHLKGDAQVYARNASGISSAIVECRVAPPPK